MRHLLCIIVLLFAFSNSYAQDQAIREIIDLQYVDAANVENDALQRLNLVLPVGQEDAPLLVWVGGGAWSYVDRAMEMDLARKFAEQGIAVASVGHRLSTAVWRDSSLNVGIQHPKHVEDVATAVKWLYDNADTYGYDRAKTFLGGFSSGAHLVALLALDDTYLSNVGLSKDFIRGVIPISGAYDILNYYNVFRHGSRPDLADSHVMAVFGQTEADLIEASPTTYLTGLGLPMLIMTDQNVFNYTRILEDRIRETDFTDFQVINLHHISHGDLWRHLSYEESSIYRDMIQNFIESQLSG